jgi:predicted PurR-regulated permease PerM
MTTGRAVPSAPQSADWFSRERVLALTLLGATLLVLYVCYRLVQPFLPALAGALALAVVAYPLHRLICRLIPQSTLSAALAVLAVMLVIIGPAVFVTHHLVREATTAVQTAKDMSGRWRIAIERNPRVAPVLAWIEEQIDLDVDKLARQAAGVMGSHSGELLSGSVWVVTQLLITLFVLFYFFRARRATEQLVRSLMPLSERETDEVFARVKDTIRATVFGSLVVAAVQGAAGGLMFAILGIPGALFWGIVMALLATVPVMGTFVVWAPAAAFLALEGNWGKALILAGWGILAIGLVDNLLYPLVVGTRLQLHPLPVFFSILGGLTLFGAAGVILGPVTLAVADALIDLWRRRTAAGRTAEEAARLPSVA